MVPVEKNGCFSEGWKCFFSLLTRIRMYLPELVAILNGSGGKRNMFFRGVESFFLC